MSLQVRVARTRISGAWVAAVGGALLIAQFGSARVLQLRRTVRRRRPQDR